MLKSKSKIIKYICIFLFSFLMIFTIILILINQTDIFGDAAKVLRPVEDKDIFSTAETKAVSSSPSQISNNINKNKSDYLW